MQLQSEGDYREEIHNRPIDPAAMPMTQKKENSTNSRNGELRALETFSDILIFSRLEIIRFNSFESLLWFLFD